MTYSFEHAAQASPEHELSPLQREIAELLTHCNYDTLFGETEKRAELAVDVYELAQKIKSDAASHLAAEERVAALYEGVAQKAGDILREIVNDKAVTNELIKAVRGLPLPAPKLEKEIRFFYVSAFEAHDRLDKAKSDKDREELLREAKAKSKLATSLGQAIPEIKEGRRREASGGAVHRRVLLESDKLAKESGISPQAAKSFVRMMHKEDLPTKTSAKEKIGRVVATVATTGALMSVLPVGAAHAGTAVEQKDAKASPDVITNANKPVTIVKPAAAPGPEKPPVTESTPAAPTKAEVTPDKAAPTPATAAVAPKTETSELTSPKNDTKSQTDKKTDKTESAPFELTLPKNDAKTAKSGEEIKDVAGSVQVTKDQPTEIKNETPKDAPVAIPNEKEKSEQTGTPKTEETISEKPYDQSPGKTDTKTESGSFEIALPKVGTKADVQQEIPASEKNDKKDDAATKIIDHLKEDAFEFTLPLTKKEDKNDKGDSAKEYSKTDEPKIETIGQKDSPTEKIDLNTKIVNVITGNGPIELSLEGAKERTKEREKTKNHDQGGEGKGKYKPQFEFAPSAELPPPPKPKADTYHGAPIPDVIIDAGLAGETSWTPEQLTIIHDNLDSYLAVAKRTGMPWELGAALHARETSLGFVNPANGQGLFQLYSSGAHFAPGPVSKENFETQLALGMNFIKKKGYELGYTDAQMTLANPDVIKDILFSYNGRSEKYIEQARNLGFTRGAEGSPYVMNLADEKRNNKTNPDWKQILTDNGPMGNANQAPGAWLLIEGLVHVETKAHEQAVAQQETERKAAEEKAAADAAEAERQKNRTITEVEPFTAWHDPVPAGITTSSQFGVRGYDAAGNPIMHTGIDFGAGMGTPFYAAAGGTVSVFVSGDVRAEAWCQKAIAGTGNGMNVVKDPYQKEVHVTTKIGNDTYVTIYAHMSEVSVAPGQIVKAGQALGKTGNSGCSTGPHAHFEVRKNGVPIDPNTILGGAIQASSSEIKVADDGHEHDNHEDVSTETVSMGVGTAMPSDDQKSRLDAIRQVAELKRRMAETQRNNEGYLAVR